MFRKILVHLLVMSLLLLATSVVSAQSNRPVLFCEGGLPWVYTAGDNIDDPGCGPGRFVVQYDAGGYTGEIRVYNWPNAEYQLEGISRNGTYWYEPASWYANTWKIAPAGFCAGGVSWYLDIEDRPVNPGCGPGTYIIHYDAGGYQGENRQASWEGAERERWGSARTLWYEPQFTYPTAPGGFCEGGIPWILQGNSLPVNPNCPTGRYSVDYDGFSDFRYSFNDAVSTLGIRAGTFWFEPESWYAGQPLPPQQEPLPACPAGYGSRTGIYPGDYYPEELTNDERQDLFELFGNVGTASVGYGGQRCEGGHERGQPKVYGSSGSSPSIPPCPAGVGEPGIFDPTTLTQQQRNELYWAFGHSGEASVGYGGEQCYGGTMTLPSFNPDPQDPPPPDPDPVDPPPDPDPADPPPNDPDPTGFVTVPYFYSEFNHTYTFEVQVTANNTCLIQNGDSVVADEINRYYAWINPKSSADRLASAVVYLADLVGTIDVFRQNMEFMMTNSQGCNTVLYNVGGRIMDTSGLGNIMFGFHSSTYDVPQPNLIGAIDQFFHPQTLGQRYDNPDDAVQIDVGQSIALFKYQGYVVDAALVAGVAQQLQLN